MKLMKKALAVLLSVLMVLSIGVVAFAAEGDDETPAETETVEEETTEVRRVSSDHECPYCGEMHDDKTVDGLATGFFHIILYVFEQFKSIFNIFSK